MMKKRLLSILLILVMCMGSIPMTLFSVGAEKAGAIYVAGVLMNDGEYLANGASAVQTSKPSKGYAFYKDGILTLRNFSYTGIGYNFSGSDYALIYSDSSMRIVLEGENTLKGTSAASAIQCTISLQITGEGSLSIDAKDGLVVNGGVNIVDTTVEITASGSGISCSMGDAYIYDSDVWIHATYNAFLVYEDLDVYLSKSNVFAYSEKQMAIGQAEIVSAINSYVVLGRGNDSHSLVNASTFDAPSANVMASTGSDINNSSAYENYDSSKASDYNFIIIVPAYDKSYVRVGNAELKRGNYLATGATEVTTTRPDSGYAYFNGYTLTLDNFTYSGTGYIESEGSLGIFLRGSNSITVTTDNYAGVYVAHDLYIHGDGRLNVTADSPIYANDGVYIEDSTISVNSTSQYGIESRYKNVEINNATVYAYGVEGICANGDVKINSSYVYVSVDTYGVCSFSALYIDDSYTDIRSNNTSSDSQYYSVFASEYIYFSNQANVYASTSNSGTNAVSFNFSNFKTYDYVNATRAVLNYIDIVDIAPAETWAIADFTASADSAYTEIVDIKWYALDSNGDIFQEIYNNNYDYFSDGRTYRVYVTVRASKGKEFGDINLSAWIGDKSVQSYSTSTANAKERVLYRDFVATKNPANYTVTLDDITLKDGEYLADNGTAATTIKPSGGYAYYVNGTLTLNNFKSKNRALRYTESYLEINIIGSNKLSSINDNFINDDKPYELNIYGEGYIYVNGMGGSDGYAFNVKNAICFSSGSIDLDDEMYGFNTNEVIIDGADVYCYVSQGGAFYGECDLYVKSGSFRVFDGGGWNQNINDSVNIKQGDVYVSNNGSGDPTKADFWDGVTSLNNYEDIWILPETESVYIGGIKLKNGQYLAEGTSTPTTTKPSGGYAYFEEVDGKFVLTLNNFDLTAEDEYAIYAKGYDLTIKTVGTNTLDAINTDDGYTVYVYEGDLIAEGTGKLTVTGSDYDSIYTEYGSFIMNSGTLICNAKDDGIYADNGIIINGGAITIASDYDAITVSEGDFIINNGTMTVSSTYDDAFIILGDFYMNGGKITVTNANCCVVDAYNFYMDGGELIFGSEDYTDGLFISYDIEITDGSITMAGNGEYIDYVFYFDNLTISGGYVEIYGDYVLDIDTSAGGAITIADSLKPMASTNTDGSGAVAFNADNIDAYKYFTCGSAYAKGDVNGDGKVNLFDYVAVKSHVLGKSLLDSDQQSRADLNGDGKINMFDYVALKTLVVKG